MTIPIEPRANFMPQLVARGDGAGLFFCGGRSSSSELTSLALDDAFTAWPPKIGAPAVHALRELHGSPLPVARWLDDKLMVLGQEPFAAGWSVPGSDSLGIDVCVRDAVGRIRERPDLPMGRPIVGESPEHGIYMVRSIDERDHLFHHAATSTSAGTPLGIVEGRLSWSAVLDDGSLLFGVSDAPPEQRQVLVPGQQRRQPSCNGWRMFPRARREHRCAGRAIPTS